MLDEKISYDVEVKTEKGTSRKTSFRRVLTANELDALMGRYMRQYDIPYDCSNPHKPEKILSYTKLVNQDIIEIILTFSKVDMKQIGPHWSSKTTSSPRHFEPSVPIDRSNAEPEPIDESLPEQIKLLLKAGDLVKVNRYGY